jgi:hypothetical protein
MMTAVEEEKPLPRRLMPGDGKLNQGDPVGDKIE